MILAALTALLLGWLLPERACGRDRWAAAGIGRCVEETGASPARRQGLGFAGLIDRQLMREPAQPAGRPAGPATRIPVDQRF